VKIAAFGLALQPLAIAKPVFALHSFDLAGNDSACPKRRLAHHHRAFEQLPLRKREIEAV
jgi:hypothetical protein